MASPDRRFAAAAAAAVLLAIGAAPPAYPDQAAIMREINAVRTDPARYAVDLRRVATGYRGVYRRGADGIERASREGAAAVIEAAAALDRQPPLPPLAIDEVLGAAARDHVLAQGPAGTVGHASTAGATPGERTARRGGGSYVGEIIAYGHHAATDVVRSFVVDDGVAGRGHRRLLLSPGYRFAGASCGPHASWGTMCVVVLAAQPGGRAGVPAR